MLLVQRTAVEAPSRSIASRSIHSVQGIYDVAGSSLQESTIYLRRTSNSRNLRSLEVVHSNSIAFAGILRSDLYNSQSGYSHIGKQRHVRTSGTADKIKWRGGQHVQQASGVLE